MSIGPERRAPTEQGRARPRRGTLGIDASLELLAELSLLALTLAAVLGLARLFDDGSFLLPVAAFALAAHALAAGARRWRLGGVAATGLAVGGLLLGVSWLLLPETLALLVPTGETLRQAGHELSAALETFRDVVAPAPVEPGFVLASSVAVWLVAFAADTAAFRARAPVEAAVPASTVFVFAAALGARGDDQQLALTGIFLGALVAHWLAQRALAHASAPTWLTSDARAGAAALLRVGGLLGIVGVAAALVIGPALPGADASPVIPWRASDREDPGSRVTISPLVDIRSRLVDQADVEVFRVRSDRRSYWRLTSLETFDGRIWSSTGRYRSADGRLEADVRADRARTDAVVQEFEISGLATIWLPAAFRPVAVAGVEAGYDADSGSLIPQDADQPLPGLRYTVESTIKVLEADELQAVPSVAPADLAAEHTALPEGFSPAVRDLAASATTGSSTQYETARRLQDFFRSGAFTYDLGVSPGHGGNDLERFLFETRRGYCEQFAGAYAAMARSLNLPARVAVGFTPGQLDPDDGRYEVRGFNAHAWPEVYLDGYGWVAFEPTPGRGMPGAEAYTGVPEQQAVQEAPETATTLPAPPTTVAPDAPGAPPTSVAGSGGVDPGQVPEEEVDEGSPWPRRLLVAAALVLGAPAAWIAGVAALAASRRSRRRASAQTAQARVLVAWDEVTEALARGGLPPHAWETPSELARRAGGRADVDERILHGLAEATTAARFADAGISPEVGRRAEEAAARLERDLDRNLDRGARLRRAFDPRPHLPSSRPRVEVRESDGLRKADRRVGAR